MRKTFLIAIYLLLVLGKSLQANESETLELFRLPLANDHKEFVIYSTLKANGCTFPVDKTIDGILYNRKNKIFEKFNFLEKIYFKIKKVKFTRKTLKLSLSFASNVSFTFRYDNCDFKKEITINEITYPFESIDIVFSDALSLPVLDYFLIKNKGIEKKLYQHVLDGHVPLYELKVGPAVSIRTNFRPGNRKSFRKKNPTIQPIPAFIFRYANFFINKDGAGSAVYAKNGLLALVAAIRDGEPYRREGIIERENGIMFGPIIKYHNFQFRYMKNWLDKEKGSEFKVTYSQEYRPTHNFHLIPRVYAQIWNKKYSDYYLGVSEKEIFEPYEGKFAINYSAMLRALYFHHRVIFLADFGVKFFDKNVYQSPIVNTKTELRMTLGVLYRVF